MQAEALAADTEGVNRLWGNPGIGLSLGTESKCLPPKFVPMDLIVNKTLKLFISRCYQHWNCIASNLIFAYYEILVFRGFCVPTENCRYQNHWTFFSSVKLRFPRPSTYIPQQKPFRSLGHVLNLVLRPLCPFGLCRNSSSGKLSFVRAVQVD
jgi:hypothetical protein